MTQRQRFIAALERQPLTGRVPHFELVFYLTMEAFGRVHPSHRNYDQWLQMEEKERELHRRDMAELYIATAERYEHSAIFIHPNPAGMEELQRMVDLIRERTGDHYFLMAHGDATFAVPNGTEMESFSCEMVEAPDKLKAQAAGWVREALARAEKLRRSGGLDGFALCADYCFNTGPFLSPARFSEFVTPYLAELTKGYRDLGYYVIKHTDGNIMPIIDQLVQTKPHALHSLDPQGDVDIAEVKRLYGHELCLIGNVHCGMLDTGTPEQIDATTRYALQHGMPGGGYIFSTSNCIYTGMPLASYERMLEIWRREGNYPSLKHAHDTTRSR
ncbi:MAG: uroporphyrinogen decarboxylase family protein [Cephaloticoccus sp.]|nr:uroporphyrinogen decarboxylase family protein [Cephaloticoccus sp.]MCF7759250.1 uroporphyrinogen decarboxylase family protein [Cephaloticoccus sp.]